MNLRETDLPGIGKKFTVSLASGSELSLILHKSGRREVYVAPDDDSDAEQVLALEDEEARLVGAVLGGAYYQPVCSEALSFAVQDLYVDWLKVGERSPALGRTIGMMEVRKKTGASIIAIIREGGTIASPGPGDAFLLGDKVMASGLRGQVDALRKLIEG
jgi:TrkA domain protein